MTKPTRPIGIVPGALGATALGTVAFALAGFIPGMPSPLLVGLIIGALVATFVPWVSDAVQPGSTALGTRMLRIGIVLLGARGSFALVADVGPTAIVVVAATMTAVFAFVAFVAHRYRLAPELAVLLAVGTAICGNTAVAAAAPLVGARRADVALAIGTITLFGTLALVAYPALGGALGLDSRTFGIWAGAGVHDTSQVVATGFAFSPAAGEIATIVKLGRNSLMLPILVALALIGRTGAPRLGAASSAVVLVGGYGAMVAANSAGLLPEIVQGGAVLASAWALTIAITAVGLSLRVGELRALGRSAVATGLGASVVGGTVALIAGIALR